MQKISPPPGFDPRTVRRVAGSYTDCAIPAHTSGCSTQEEYMSTSIGDCSLASNVITMAFIFSYIYLNITYICMYLRTVMAPTVTNIPNIFSTFICFISVHRRILLTYTIIINKQTHIFQYIQPHIIIFHQHVAVTSVWVSCNKNIINIPGRLLPHIFCLMVIIFRLILVLLYI